MGGGCLQVWLSAWICMLVARQPHSPVSERLVSVKYAETNRDNMQVCSEKLSVGRPFSKQLPDFGLASCISKSLYMFPAWNCDQGHPGSFLLGFSLTLAGGCWEQAPLPSWQVSTVCMERMNIDWHFSLIVHICSSQKLQKIQNNIKKKIKLSISIQPSESDRK